MLKVIFIIIKKELKLIIRNRGVWLTFFLPAILFPVLNIGSSYICDTNNINQQKYKISIIGENRIYTKLLNEKNITIIKTNTPLECLKNNNIDIIVDFDKSIITYNSKNFLSLVKANTFSEKIQQYSIHHSNEKNNSLYKIENENGNVETPDVSLRRFLMPIVFILFVSNSCSKYADDMFAGEKEKGTLEILFSSKIRKSSIFLGKACSLIIIELLNIIVSLISFNISIAEKQSINEKNELYLFFAILSLGCLSCFISLSISLLAKNVRESQIINSFILSIPAMISLINMLSIFKLGKWIYTIPIINSIELITNSLSNSGNAEVSIVTFTTNAVICFLISLSSINYMKKEKVLQI